MIRQPVALLLAFAMFHLSVARVDEACALHGHDAPAKHHAGMQHHGGAPEHTDEAPSDGPASRDCGHALASCGPILGIDGGSATISTAAIVHMTIAAAVSERPLSHSTAPEPPPPKA